MSDPADKEVQMIIGCTSPSRSNEEAQSPPNSAEKTQQTDAQQIAQTNTRLSFMTGVTQALIKLSGKRRRGNTELDVDRLAEMLEDPNNSSASRPSKRRKSLSTHLGQPKIW